MPLRNWVVSVCCLWTGSQDVSIILNDKIHTSAPQTTIRIVSNKFRYLELTKIRPFRQYTATSIFYLYPLPYLCQKSLTMRVEQRGFLEFHNQKDILSVWFNYQNYTVNWFYMVARLALLSFEVSYNINVCQKRLCCQLTRIFILKWSTHTELMLINPLFNKSCICTDIIILAKYSLTVSLLSYLLLHVQDNLIKKDTSRYTLYFTLWCYCAYSIGADRYYYCIGIGAGCNNINQLQGPYPLYAWRCYTYMSAQFVLNSNELCIFLKNLMLFLLQRPLLVQTGYNLGYLVFYVHPSDKHFIL